jgi:hypothetical protein
MTILSIVVSWMRRLWRLQSNEVVFQEGLSPYSTAARMGVRDRSAVSKSEERPRVADQNPLALSGLASQQQASQPLLLECVLRVYDPSKSELIGPE